MAKIGPIIPRFWINWIFKLSKVFLGAIVRSDKGRWGLNLEILRFLKRSRLFVLSVNSQLSLQTLNQT